MSPEVAARANLQCNKAASVPRAACRMQVPRPLPILRALNWQCGPLSSQPRLTGSGRISRQS
jgi:hypothetical protein